MLKRAFRAQDQRFITSLTFWFVVVSLLTGPASADLGENQTTGAQWIWTDQVGPEDSWVAFRKEITLEQVPAEAPTKIAADSKYWLWVNGRLVVFEGGLKRGPRPDATWMDVIDLAPHLKVGSNTIAVLVWYWGSTAFLMWTAAMADSSSMPN